MKGCDAEDTSAASQIRVARCVCVRPSSAQLESQTTIRKKWCPGGGTKINFLLVFKGLIFFLLNAYITVC